MIAELQDTWLLKLMKESHWKRSKYHSKCLSIYYDLTTEVMSGIKVERTCIDEERMSRPRVFVELVHYSYDYILRKP